MDKNSITGVILIILIVIGYNALFPPVVQEAQNIEINLNILDLNPYKVIIIRKNPKKAFLDVVRNNK